MERFKKTMVDGSVLLYDKNHYMEVVKQRKWLGLGEVDSKKRNVELKNHPLVGTKIKSKWSGKKYTVEKVNKQWFNGFYLGMLLENNGSHVFAYFENINCEDETVLENIEKTKKEFDIK